MTFKEGEFYTLNEVVDIARYQQERIKLLEQRIIDLQGHDDLSYIDRKLRRLSEQESKWVGLTDDEVNSWELPDTPTVFEFAQFIEAKLKEKNGG